MENLKECDSDDSVPECKNLMAELDAVEPDTTTINSCVTGSNSDADVICSLDETRLRPEEFGGKEEDSGLKDDSGHIRVYLRVRPLTDDERSRGLDDGCVAIESNRAVILTAPQTSHAFRSSTYGLARQRQRFTFSRVFNADTTQKQFFDETVQETVSEFVSGQNCLIFTYGVTNSGKTYTIQGDVQRDGGGILPRSLDVIFGSIAGRQLTDMRFKPFMFGDVARLTNEQMGKEKKVKEKILHLTMGSRENIADGQKSTTKKLSDVSDAESVDTDLDAAESNVDETTTFEHIDCDQTRMSVDSLEARVSLVQNECPAGNQTTDPHIRFSLWASFAEIYNEQVYDLLMPQELASNRQSRTASLQLRDDPKGRPYIRGLREVQVSNPEEARRILEIGRQNLHVASTRMNRASSRSHCIFTLRLVQVADCDSPSVARVASLSFCDLAGSERYQSTCSYNDRVKEAGNINSSLLTLGRCIDTLRRNQARKDQASVQPTPQKRVGQLSFIAPTPQKHPDVSSVMPTPQSRKDPNAGNQLAPFRESKLTRLFQNFLCGEGRVVMIINISQCSNVFDETLHALKYSALARQVVIGPPCIPFASISLTPAPTQKRKISLHHKQPATAVLSKSFGKKRKTADTKVLAEVDETDLIKSRTTHVDEESSDAAEAKSVTEEDAMSEESDECSDSDDEDTPVPSWHEERQKMIRMMQQLHAALAEEKRSKEGLETRIRQEVCNEMQKQLVRIENEYQEGIRIREEICEEKYEKKMEIYMEAVQKSYKRQRNSEDDEYVPSVELHAARMKIEERNDRIKELEQQIKVSEQEALALHDNFKKISAERDSFAEKLTKAEFFASDAQHKLETMQGSAMANVASDEVGVLRKRIQELENQLSAKAEPNCAAVSELQAKLSDLEHRHEMTCRQLRREKTQLEQRLKKVEKEHEEWVNTNETPDVREGQSARVTELELQLKQRQTVICEMESHIQSLEKANKDAEQSWTEHCQELEILKQEKCTELMELRATCDRLERDLSKQIKLASESEAAAKSRLSECDKIRQVHEDKLLESQKMETQLQEDCHKLKVDLEVAEQKLADQDKILSESDAECKSLKSRCTELEQRLVTADRECVEMRCLITQLEEAKQKLQAASEAESEAVNSVKHELSETAAEVRKLKAELSEKISEIVKLEKLNIVVADLEQRLSASEAARKEAELQVSVCQSVLESSQKQMELVRNETKIMTEQLKQSDDREKLLQSQLLSSVQLGNELQEQVKKQTATCEQAELHKRMLETLKEELARVQNDHTSTVKQLESEVADKDQKLNAKYATIDELIEKMEKERAYYEIALKDARCNESVIEKLHHAVAEQELTMQAQDRALHDRDMEIKTLNDRLLRLRTDHEEELTELKGEFGRHEVELTKQLDSVQEQSQEKDRRIRELEKEARKAEKSKQCLEKDVRDATAELKTAEHRLAEQQRELSSAQLEIEKLKSTAETSSKGLAKELIQRDSELLALREQLKAAVEKREHLESEIDELHKRCQTIEASKEKELIAWRAERDSIVSELEKLIGEKDADIKQLKQASKGRGHAKSAATDVDKDNAIKNLNHKLEELQKNQDQLERVVRIKDQTISDLREQHLQLQQQMWPGSEDGSKSSRKSRVPKTRMPLHLADSNADVSVSILEDTISADTNEIVSDTPVKKSRRVKTSSTTSPLAENAQPKKSLAPSPKVTAGAQARGCRRRQTSVAETGVQHVDMPPPSEVESQPVTTSSVRKLRSRRIV